MLDPCCHVRTSQCLLAGDGVYVPHNSSWFRCCVTLHVLSVAAQTDCQSTTRPQRQSTNLECNLHELQWVAKQLATASCLDNCRWLHLPLARLMATWEISSVCRIMLLDLTYIDAKLLLKYHFYGFYVWNENSYSCRFLASSMHPFFLHRRDSAAAYAVYSRSMEIAVHSLEFCRALITFIILFDGTFLSKCAWQWNTYSANC